MPSSQSDAFRHAPASMRGAWRTASAQLWPESAAGPAVGGAAWLPSAGAVTFAQTDTSTDPVAQSEEFRAAAEQAAGDAHFERGEFREASEHYGEALRRRPGDAGLCHKLGCAARGANEPSKAERHFHAALLIDPKHPGAQDALAQLYLDLDHGDLALKHSAIALALSPLDPEFIITRAGALDNSGDAAGAWALLGPLIGREMPSIRAGWLYAKLAPRIGHESQAATLLGRLLASPHTAPGNRALLHFALAGLLDRMGRHDDAFGHAMLGNQLRPHPHDPAITEARITRQLRHCTRRQLRALPHATHASTRPVFIVGMPRSGTSLAEQILASHPLVYGAGELPDIPRMADAIAQRAAYPECLDTLSFNTFNRLASQYLSVLSALDPAARYVIDKLPLNALYLDLIQLLFPECRVIHCVRDPVDTCLSCYMTDFAEGNGFTRDLGQLGHFYRQYQRLMAHWRGTLSLPMLQVRYEDVVADLPSEARRMLEFLDLPWDPRCLDFHKTNRPVVTASREQVRRPIYGSSVGRWKNYEKHLAPLLRELASANPPA